MLYDLFSIFAYICAQRSAVEYSDISFQVQEAQNMVTNVGKDGTFPAYSCFSTIDSFRFEEIVSGNGAFQVNAPFHCFEQVIIFNNAPKCSVKWNNRSLLSSLRWSSWSLFLK